MEKISPIQAHGLTVDEMAELHYRQKNDLPVPMIQANNSDESQIKDPYFKEYIGHQIPRHESHLYHALTDARIFDVATGRKLSIVVKHIFTREAFEFQKNNFGFSGQVVHVLHNPESGSDSVLK